MRNIVIYPLRIYRNYLSQFKLQCCRFYPSCSQYAIEAVERYGLFNGVWKAIKRVLRCHPLSKGGYDPI